MPNSPNILYCCRRATCICSSGRRPSLNVERLGAGDLAGGVGGDLVDPRLRLPQQFLAPPFQGLAPFVNGDGFLQRHLAVLEPLDDRFKFLERALEAQLPDVDLGVFGHIAFPDAPLASADLNDFMRTYCGGLHAPINAVTCAATDSCRPCRS